jgi:uncharacterized protein (TIGR00725 family)
MRTSRPAVLIGVIGPGEAATARDVEDARRAGELVARRGWVLLTGGRAAGVMDAAGRGALDAGGVTVGILPGQDATGASEALSIAIVTGIAEARNNVVALSCAALLACGMNPGTAAEVGLALRAGKSVVLVRPDPRTAAFFRMIGGERIIEAPNPDEAIEHVARLIAPAAGRGA